MSMPSIAEAKAELRRRCLERRRAIPEAQRERKSLQIADHLLEWEICRKAETIHCFLTIEANAEVQTGPLLNKLLKEGKRMVVPRVIRGENRLEHLLYESTTPIVRRGGIPEPERGIPVPQSEFDLVLVPMLAADRQKNRLGYGMGFYDRFLHGCAAVRTGLLFSELLLAEPIPVEAHDVRLDALVTEEGVL